VHYTIAPVGVDSIIEGYVATIVKVFEEDNDSSFSMVDYVKANLKGITSDWTAFLCAYFGCWGSSVSYL